jgi:hypothetical protein
MHSVGTNSGQLVDETMAFSVDASSEPTVSPDEIVSSLRELRESLERVSALASEEDVTAKSFLETLRSIPVTISRLPLEPSLLPDRWGLFEDARLNPEGVLILTSPGGGIETVDLLSFENRDLLVSVIEDLMEMLRGIATGIPVLSAVPCVEPDVEMTVLDKPVIEEPMEIAKVAEPESTEELSPPSDEIDEHAEARLFVEPDPGEPPIEAFSLLPPDPVEYEHHPVPPGFEESIFTPNVQSNSVLRRFRDRVLRQRGEASRGISEIRRLRDMQVKSMRAGAREPWVREETGFLVSLKKLLSRKSGK